MLVSIIFILLIHSHNAAAQDGAESILKEDSFLNKADEKYSNHRPNYILFGRDDWKLQFSGKYRIAKNGDIYFAYSQLMFWSFYETSRPFSDIIYNPEIFYRIKRWDDFFIRSIDVGYSHMSNGKDKEFSRSFDRYYLSFNNLKNFGDYAISGVLKLYLIDNEESTNTDIGDYLGFWDIRLLLTRYFENKQHRIDFELMIFAGKGPLELNSGGKSMGLIYHSGSENFSPAIYLQYYNGHVENLLMYKEVTNEVRLGLLFSM